MTASDPFSLPLGTSGQQIPIQTLLANPQSYFGKLTFTGGAALAFPITGGLPSPGTNPKLTFNWSNLGQPSSLTGTYANLGNISSATTYNDQTFLNGISAAEYRYRDVAIIAADDDLAAVDRQDF